jgi:hypothetical protein
MPGEHVIPQLTTQPRVGWGHNKQINSEAKVHQTKADSSSLTRKNSPIQVKHPQGGQ